MSWTA